MKRSSQNQPPPVYSPDAPIDSKKQDSLKRGTFAERLAGDLMKLDASRSMVIALYGPWGSGKTSIKNMVLEANRKQGEAALTVVDFNPWQLSGTGGIPEALFNELGIAMGADGSERAVASRTKLMTAYAQKLRLAGKATDMIGKVLPMVGVPFGPILSSAGEALKNVGDGMADGGEAMKAEEEASRKSLKEQKADLSKKMLKMDKSILVVIDDIDRLSSDEILQVFQTVKANADFPNLIYLLLFEREIVARALNEISGGRGMEFLEKIVQVAYHIPEVSRVSVENVLFAAINSEIGRDEIAKLWEKGRWIEMYSSGLAKFFSNLRHVKRFSNSFNFKIRHHLIGGGFEVNPVDLIGLETLRVFVPSVYESLIRHRAFLTRQGGGERGSDGKDWRKEVVDEICCSIDGNQKENVIKVLKNMFPYLAGDFGGDASNINLQKNRICHPDLFLKYFTLEVDDGDVASYEMNEMVGALGDPIEFERICRGFRKRGVLRVALNRLEDYKSDYDVKLVPEVIAGMSAIEDCFERGYGLTEENMEYSAIRVAYFGLKRIKNPKDRFKALLDGMAKSRGVFIPLDMVNFEQRTERRRSRGHEFLVDEDDVTLLFEAALEKLRKASKRKSFRTHPHLNWMLWRWGEWASEDEVKRWVAGRLKAPRDALWLLLTILGETHSWGNDHRIFYSVRLEELARFASVEVVTNLISRLKNQKLTKREQFAVNAFKNALKGPKDDDDWLDGEDPDIMEIVS